MKFDTKNNKGKTCAIKWAKNFGQNIVMEQWENM